MSAYLLLIILFFFYCSGDHRDLHSFPTRRSSDLGDPGEPLRSRGARGPDPPRAPVRGWRIRHLRVLRRSEEHTSELQSHHDLVCRLLLEKKKKKNRNKTNK